MSNVTLLCRAIFGVVKGSPDVQQIVYYQKGVGSSLDTIQQLTVGMFTHPEGMSEIDATFGIGVEENVRAAYGFIAHNFEDDDEIYLFGWSRGAYTARSIAGLICKFGILNRTGMDGIANVFEAYRTGSFKDDATATQKENVANLKATHTPRQALIQCVGVWDTVGSMGIPDLGFLKPLSPGISKINENYQFHDTDLHSHILNAFHAYFPYICKLIYTRLSLDEDCRPFAPTIWVKKPENKSTNLDQVWFPGTHSQVGGGDTYHDLSNITLTWMIQKVMGATGLKIDVGYLLGASAIIAKCKSDKPWGCANISTDHHKGFWSVAGKEPRTPGHYGKGGDTCESIHESVVERSTWYETQPEKWDCPDLRAVPNHEEFSGLEIQMKAQYERHVAKA